MQLEHVVNFATHPISDPQYEQACKQQLDRRRGINSQKLSSAPLRGLPLSTEGEHKTNVCFLYQFWSQCIPYPKRCSLG